MTGPMAVRKELQDISRNGFSLRKLFISTAAATLTFLGGQKFISENPEVFEPMHEAPTSFKTQFEINAKDVSFFASSDTEACVSYAFADYIAPLGEQMRDVLPLTKEVVQARQDITIRQQDIALERQKIQAEYKAEGLEVVDPESIRSNVIDILEKEIEEIRIRLAPLELQHHEKVSPIIKKFEDLVLHLHEEGLMNSLTRDQLNAAYAMLTYIQATTDNIDSDSTRAIYLATDLMPAINSFWLDTEINYLINLRSNEKVKEIIQEWKAPETDEEFLEAQTKATTLAEIILAAQYASYPNAMPGIEYFDEENKNVLAAYSSDRHNIGFNINKKSEVWKDGEQIFQTIVHEGTHSLLNVFSTISPQDGSNFSIDTVQSSTLALQSLANYVNPSDNELTYYAHPHERFARRAETVAQNYLDSPYWTAYWLKAEYQVIVDKGKERVDYQKALQTRDKVTCDNFNLSAFAQSNFVTRQFNRYNLNHPENLTP